MSDVLLVYKSRDPYLATGLGNVFLTARLVPEYGVLGAAVALAVSFAGGLVLYGGVALWERRPA